VPPLRALVDAGFDVALVVSAPDRRRGRGTGVGPTPVKAAAVELGIAVTDRVEDAPDADADLGVVVAFGRLVRAPVLARLPMVNLHLSLLPRWRGAAPVERAILAGDEETGVCLMQLEVGLDTGPLFDCDRVTIGGDETADELRARLVHRGTELLVTRLREGLGEPRPQEGEPTYADKLGPADTELDWRRTASELHRRVRVGGAWTTFRGRRLKVLRALPTTITSPPPGHLEGTVVGTGAGGLELLVLQPEGRTAQPADAWRRGARPLPDERLGT
jgi:methionyl-tRNA formyltransferase